MDNRPNPPLADAIAAAFDWWREAGVDCDFADEPADWLARETPAVAAQPVPEAMPREFGAPEPAARAVVTVDAAALPADLASFAEWWLAEPTLDDGRLGGRVPPHGVQAAEWMVVVSEPEQGDCERLLSGPQGRLLDGVLAALGCDPAQAYVASVLTRHTPMADWDAIAARGLGRVLAHHVALVRPRRLIVFGNNILPLLVNDPAHNPAVLREFHHDGGSIPLFAARGLPALLERPRWKAALWQGLLDWSAG